MECLHARPNVIHVRPVSPAHLTSGSQSPPVELQDLTCHISPIALSRLQLFATPGECRSNRASVEAPPLEVNGLLAIGVKYYTVAGFTASYDNDCPCYQLTFPFAKFHSRMNRIPNLSHCVLNFCQHDPSSTLFLPWVSQGTSLSKNGPWAAIYTPFLYGDSDLVSQEGSETVPGQVFASLFPPCSIESGPSTPDNLVGSHTTQNTHLNDDLSSAFIVASAVLCWHGPVARILSKGH